MNLPAITFTGGGGNSAAATAIVENGEVTGTIITNPGVGYTEAPTILIASASAPVNNPTYDPNNSFVSGGGSVTSGSLNVVSRALTTTADNLPQPALFGTFPNQYNAYTIYPKSYNHTFTYRGGRNVAAPDGSEQNQQNIDYGFLGLTINGCQIRGFSHGINNDLPFNIACPDGYAFDKYVYASFFGADAGCLLYTSPSPRDS